MQIEIWKENSVTFKLTNTEDGGDDITIFYGVMKKLKEESLKKGFKNMFTANEKSFIREFADLIDGV